MSSQQQYRKIEQLIATTINESCPRSLRASFDESLALPKRPETRQTIGYFFVHLTAATLQGARERKRSMQGSFEQNGTQRHINTQRLCLKLKVSKSK